jgi:hypothetical protein
MVILNFIGYFILVLCDFPPPWCYMTFLMFRFLRFYFSAMLFLPLCYSQDSGLVFFFFLTLVPPRTFLPLLSGPCNVGLKNDVCWEYSQSKTETPEVTDPSLFFFCVICNKAWLTQEPSHWMHCCLISQLLACWLRALMTPGVYSIKEQGSLFWGCGEEIHSSPCLLSKLYMHQKFVHLTVW